MLTELIDRIYCYFDQSDIGEPGGENGYSLPNLQELLVFDVTETSLEKLDALGIHVKNGLGVGNKLLIGDNLGKIDLNLTFNNRKNNCLIVQNGSNLRGNFIIEGDNHLICIGGDAAHFRIISQLVIRNTDNFFFIGNGGSIGGATFWFEGPNKSIIIGDDPMFSLNTYIRNADGHGIIDLEEKKVINCPESIYIGPHVWLGQDSRVLKNVKIGAGCVIGAGSIVTRDVPPCSIAAGVPAKVVKSGVSWTRAANPNEQQMDEIVDKFHLKQGR